MKKTIIPVACSISALAVGYLIGGMRSGRIATEQAYHSDLSYLVVITKHLEENKIQDAKEVSRHAIQGALSVLDTFKNDPSSPLIFIFPSSETLLDRKTQESIRSQADLAISDEAPVPGSTSRSDQYRSAALHKVNHTPRSQEK